MKSLRTIRPYIDTQGRNCSAVTLAKGAGEAHILTTDLKSLVGDGISPNWQLNASRSRMYVRAKLYVRSRRIKGDRVTVARIITGALPDQHVHHRDGNRLNLCRENLQIIQGRMCSHGCSDVELSDADRTPAPNAYAARNGAW